MKKLIKKIISKSTLVVLLLTTPIGAYAEVPEAEWQKPTPVFKQDYDWVKFKSDEWLKGEIISMYDEVLEFDSDELGVQKIDWEEISELRSKEWQSIRMFDGSISEGYIVVKEGQLSLVKEGVSTTYDLSQLLSIASSGANERDLWDGYVKLGINLREGNTVQVDYNFSAGLHRRSASSRFKIDYTADYSRYEDQVTEISTTTADTERLTSSYDWFFSPKIYFRAADVEYISDPFLNLDYRLVYGVAMGYEVLDTSKVTWDVNAGPSYQKSKFIDVQVDEDNIEKSFGLTLGTDFTYEITSTVDYSASYSVQMVDDESGGSIHHFQTGLEVELISDFDLDLTFYADRTENPKADSAGNIPKSDDYRLVASFGYSF